jgi:CubicO group peptidase (beta-lactamase class C family)
MYTATRILSISGDRRMKHWTILFASVVMLPLFVFGEEVMNGKDGQVEEWPDTSAASWAKAFFDAYNIEGDDALRLFVKSHYSEAYLEKTPLEKELANHLQLKKIAGRLTFHSASVDGDFSVDIIARSRLFGWMKFHIALSPEPPHDPTAISGGPTSAPETESMRCYRDWEDLDDLLEMVCNDSGVPGMAASIVYRGRILGKSATGVRRIDRPDRIRIEDRFHLGSVSKLFTGTMIGKLLDSGKLEWSTTVGGVLRDIPMRAEYREVTLQQLLGHLGGVPSLPAGGEFADGFPLKQEQSPAEARALLVRQVLTEEPVKPGCYSYSNAGYVVAAHMVEIEMKRSWEELMRTLVFEPLALQAAGFGWPATKDRPDQPLGHYGAPPEFQVQKIGELLRMGEYLSGDMAYFGPAGNLHCSIEDLARLAAFHLSVLDGGDDSLEAGTIPRFWREGKAGNGERMFCFFGSGGTFFAMIALYPDSGLAVVAAANCGLYAWKYMEKMRDAIHRRLVDCSEGFPDREGL